MFLWSTFATLIAPAAWVLAHPTAHHASVLLNQLTPILDHVSANTSQATMHTQLVTQPITA